MSATPSPSDKLRPLWEAWQSGSLDRRDPAVSAEKQRFMDVMSAVRSPRCSPPLSYGEVVRWVENQHAAMIAALGGGDNIALLRGIYDKQALEALQSLILTGKWTMPPNDLLSFSEVGEVAGGFSRLGSWAGIAFEVSVPKEDILLHPIFLWPDPADNDARNLNQEKEILVRPSRGIVIGISDVRVFSAPPTPAVKSKTELEQRLQERAQLSEEWTRWVTDHGVDLAHHRTRFASCDLF